MRISFRKVAFTGSLLLALSAGPAAAQTASIQAEMLNDWSALKTTMDKIVAEMPADKFGFKPTPAQQTFAERIMDVANVNKMLLGAVGGKAAAPNFDAKASTKEATMKALSDSFDYGIALLKEQNDQSMIQTVKAPFLGPSSKARVYWFLIGHTQDIYGQLAVYLRLNGGVPPKSQRP